MGSSSSGNSCPRDHPALDAPAASHEENARVLMAPEELPSHGEAGEEMAAGAAAGHDQSHGGSLRKEALRSIPATVRCTTMAEPP